MLQNTQGLALSVLLPTLTRKCGAQRQSSLSSAASRGNWGVDLQAGSLFGYHLLFVVLLSGLFAVFLQVSFKIRKLIVFRYLMVICEGTCQPSWMRHWTR